LAKLHRNLNNYYATKHWKEFSKKVRKETPYCELCKGTKNLQVHHLRYRFFKEKRNDVRVLCENCHLRKVHQQKGELDMLDILDFNHVKNRGDRLNYLIDEALTRNQESPRTYLGGSRLGHECARALQYEYYGTPKDNPVSGQLLRTFAIGHVLEDLAVSWLRKAGLDLRVKDKEGKQFGFITGKGKIKGHIDGVIVGGLDEFGPYPRLWENKTASAKKWREFAKHKVQKVNLTYYIQVQTYMAYMNLTDNPALWTCINKDDSSLYHEDISFDADVAQQASDRAVTIIQACEAGELLPRQYPGEDFFQCRFCDWGIRCWHG